MSVFERVAALHAGVEQVWAGGPVRDSAVVRWEDGVVVITPSELHRGAYTFGVYDAEGWEECGEPLCDYVDVSGEDAALELLADLTGLQPEFTDWSAWASVWLPDAVCDGRVAGAVPGV